MKVSELRPVRATWFIILLSVMILACEDGGGGDDYDPDNTYATISSSKAVLNQYYTGKVTVYSNYVETVVYHANVDGILPPGISWNSYSGEFTGTPTQTGRYSVTVYYRDPNKGTYQHPDPTGNMWYTKVFEIEVSRFQQPEYTTTVSVACTNNTTYTITFYVDGSSVATLGPGDSSTVWVTSGKRIFQYGTSDGYISGEEVWSLEPGQTYTYSVKPR